jgi:phytol kinase
MITIAFGLLIGFCILLLAEALLKDGKISTELTRKIIHLVSGLILIVWSFYISLEAIIGVEILFMIAAAITRRFGLFGSQKGINRISWGEFFFPTGVILIILLGASRAVFILAVLHLAIADAAAALVGKRYGKGNSYKVLGQKKSIAGSLAFLAVSLILVAATFWIAPSDFVEMNKIALLLLPLVTTLAENLGVYGTDNLLIPLAVLLLLG